MNTKTKHTPGPWRYRTDKNDDGQTIIGTGTPYHVMPAGGDPIPLADCTIEANAALIAAAPDLLAALEDVLRFCVTPKGMPDKDKGRTLEQQAALDNARAILAKATGEL